MAFGNWVLRGFFKPNSLFKFGARAFFDSESKDATIEMGGKYRASHTLALYWKVRFILAKARLNSLCKMVLGSSG